MTAVYPAAAAGRSEPAADHDVARRIDPRRTPITVAEIDLDRDSVRLAPADAAPEAQGLPDGEVMALVRLHRRPLGLVCSRLDGTDDTPSRLVELARRELAARIEAHHAADERAASDRPVDPVPGEPPCAVARHAALSAAPSVSVVVATRERPQQLARCLDSLLNLRYPRFEIIVVDNAPVTDSTARLVEERYRDLVTYAEEPARGLANAHNRGLAEAAGSIVAFTDDDVVADRDWLAALVEAFADSPRAGCVTGLILPAQLDTAAQAMLERRGGFAKGFSRVEHGASLPGTHPLFPFTAGRLGSGANMAFRADALRLTGGFDPSTGTGTVARGGDDLLAFFRIAAAGHTVVYQPDALIWHHHRRETAALADQAFGYGVGLGAYLAAAITREPRMIPPLLRRLPRGALYALRNSHADTLDPNAWPGHLARLERRGLLYGPIAYGRSRWRSRTAAPSVSRRPGSGRD